MLELIWSNFVNKNVRVTIDNSLNNSILAHNPDIDLGNQTIDIPIRLFKLALAIGLINSVRLSRRTKIIDGLGFINRIVLHQGNNLRVILDRHDDDKQLVISKQFGEGISAVVADYLYKLKWSTLSKIPRKGMQSKPDMECISSLNRSMVWEAKGSINPFSPADINKAVAQKGMVIANIRFASLSKLNQNQITEVRLEDPPSDNPENPLKKEILLKADHYSKVFNLIGQRKLSKYFNLMRKRIIYDEEFPDFTKKTLIFREIRYKYIRIYKNHKTFLGTIEKLSDDEYIFIGIDRNLITLSGFRNFVDYENDEYIEEKSNKLDRTDMSIIMRTGSIVPKIMKWLKEKGETNFPPSKKLIKEFMHKEGML